MEADGTEHREQAMKLEKFERKSAKRAGVTIEHLREFHEITPCDCGKKKCKGWKVRYRFGAERRRLARA